MARKKSDKTPKETPEERIPVNPGESSGQDESAAEEKTESATPDPAGDDSAENDDSDDVTEAVEGADANSQIHRMMDQNFIEYASYVIKDRAIPDVDDGLKPVQRRILWTLHRNDNGTFHKVAGIVGDTMKFHPHGDASIYEALVNLANKEYFIDKQGSFGSVVMGTPAAAGRYIECRLGQMGRDVLFNDDITPLVDSYDGRNQEPVVLPSKVPTLLMMGSDGVAVGTKTKILPHNFTELLQAQIAILRGEDFQLYPDFLQGGIMDVSEYQDGLGKVLLRARIGIEGRNLIIKEIPASTNTAKLTDTIVAAVEKSKIKISKVDDYSAENVSIQLQPFRGYDPNKALNALYTYTDCQMSVSCQSMVIVDNRPEEITVSAILRRNTDRLVRYLTWELQIEAAKALDKILSRTLAQIFIEEKIYKQIEKCKSKETMFTEVRKQLEKFEDEWLPIVQHLHQVMEDGPKIHEISKEDRNRLEQLSNGIIPDIEIEKLVEIPIRRIAAFEIAKNKEEIDLLQKTLTQAEKNLRGIKRYTIKYLEGLIEKYGPMFPRRTEICLEGFTKIDKAAAALNNIRVGWDKGNCYIGTHVKSDDIVLCNEFDHLLCVERSGEYKVIDIPEKIFIDRLYEFRKYDKNTVFGIVYSEKKTGRAFFKRTVIESFIKDKEYRIAPEGCRLELITPRPNALYEIKVDTPIRAKQVQTINLMDAPMRSPKAGGTLISPRKLLKITFSQYVDEPSSDGEPDLIEVDGDAPDADAAEGTTAPETTTLETDLAASKKSYSRKSASATPSAKPEKSNPPVAPEAGKTPDEEENWGMTQQPDLGF